MPDVIILRGVGVSPGTVVGPAVWRGQGRGSAAGGAGNTQLDESGPEGTDLGKVAPDQVPAEVEKFENARVQASMELQELAGRLRRAGSYDGAAIIDAQRAMVNDPQVAGLVRARISEEYVTAGRAIREVFDAQAEAMLRLPDVTLAARAQDVKDVASRLLLAVSGEPGEEADPEFPSILLAEDLSPSETARLDRRMVLGFATERGGRDSHTAILARSLGIPAVAGVDAGLAQVPPGTTVLLDGSRGLVLAGGDALAMRDYADRQPTTVADPTAGSGLQRPSRPARVEPAVTLDGRHVPVLANISSLDDLPAALAAGAEGVGLLRTEFLFLGRDTLPGEEEQYQVYSRIARSFAPRRVVIRTLDAGGDKKLDGIAAARETNPALGLRGIRLSLARPDLFRVQLRAICRVSALNNVAVMFPMLSAVSELEHAREILRQVRDELRAERVPLAADMDTGIMIETPAAALLVDKFAPLCSFLSLGTNDLAQYTVAADRDNPGVAGLLRPFPKAVLRLVKLVLDAAHAYGLRVGMCGEAAADPELTAALLGLGLDEFSVEPRAIAAVRRTVSQTSMDDATRAARNALE